MRHGCQGGVRAGQASATTWEGRRQTCVGINQQLTKSFDGSQLSSEPCKSILVHKLTSVDAPYVTPVLYSCNSCVPVPAHQYCNCNPSQCPHPPQPWPLILPPLSLVRPIYHLWYVMIFSLIVKRTMIWSVSILTHSWQHCFQSSENAWKMPG